MKVRFRNKLESLDHTEPVGEAEGQACLQGVQGGQGGQRGQGQSRQVRLGLIFEHPPCLGRPEAPGP